MIFGFGGMRTDGDVLIFQPTLPEARKAYRFRVRYQGAMIEVRMSRAQVEFQVISGPSVTVRVYGKNHLLDTKGFTLKPQPVD
jgi:maltose phosphorylase